MSLDRYRDLIHDLVDAAARHREQAAEHLAKADELDRKVAEMEAFIARPAPKAATS